MLYCVDTLVINIDRAIHGRRQHASIDSPLAAHCATLETDCLTDVTSFYNWSACRDQRHCVVTLSRFNDTRHCADYQQLIYLQVRWVTLCRINIHHTM